MVTILYLVNPTEQFEVRGLIDLQKILQNIDFRLHIHLEAVIHFQ